MDPRVLSEYFKRCFLAVDGLWFMMLEDTDSFEKALEVDRKVWEVLPKIQARKIRELFKMEYSEDSNEEHLIKALEFKLAAEDFVSELKREDSCIRIIIKECPWLALLRKSKREHLAEKIGDAICLIEYVVFAGEFVDGLDFNVTSRRCSGDQVCTFVLKK
jgi:predicted ArsR family transcriptional regulator